MSVRVLFLSLVGAGTLYLILMFGDSRHSHPKNLGIRPKYAVDEYTELQETQPISQHSPTEQPTSVRSPIQQSTSVLPPIQEPTSVRSPIQQPTSVRSPIEEPTSVPSPIQQPTSLSTAKNNFDSNAIRKIYTCDSNYHYNLSPVESKTRMVTTDPGLPYRTITSRIMKNIRESDGHNTKAVNEVDVPLEESELQRSVIMELRNQIRDDLIGYQYPNGRYNISASKLDDLVMEKNGRPIRSLIVTSWRSGSTFFGDAIDAHPANFYHFEPLLGFPDAPIWGPPFAEEALKIVKALFNCEYEDLGAYIESAKVHPWLFNHNKPLWNQCKIHEDLCYNHKFISAMCKLFPFQSMKLVRLGLNVAQELLADERLAVRIVLLVRDPRGILQSRKPYEWCMRNPRCAEPDFICTGLASDYKLALELLKKYPTTFKVLRYEDLATEPYEHVKEVSRFYGLDFHENMKEFLDTHTKMNGGGPYATFRDSKAARFHWTTELEYDEVEKVQRSCTAAMEYWGYLPAMNATHQREFNPVTEYSMN